MYRHGLLGLNYIPNVSFLLYLIVVCFYSNKYIFSITISISKNVPYIYLPLLHWEFFIKTFLFHIKGMYTLKIYICFVCLAFNTLHFIYCCAYSYHVIPLSTTTIYYVFFWLFSDVLSLDFSFFLTQHFLHLFIFHLFLYNFGFLFIPKTKHQ